MGSETRGNSLARSMGPMGAIVTVIVRTLGMGLFVTIGIAISTTGPSVILAVAITGGGDFALAASGRVGFQSESRAV